MLSSEQCQNARKSRDSRFDGQFIVAVKTTGIFCRPICPANLPKEENVEYFQHSTQALLAGYRPCLRCRPESAPGSWAWQGVETTFKRAIALIDEGALQEGSLTDLSQRLGITDRYLRKLFANYLGMPAKTYSQYQQLMFSKQLLHSSNLAIQEVAIASGFNSVRRFNDAFQKILHLTPSDIKRSVSVGNMIELEIPIRGHFNFDYAQQFYQLRAVAGMEKVSNRYYQRTFTIENRYGVFRLLKPKANQRTVKLQLQLESFGDIKKAIAQIRKQFDLDADSNTIESHLAQAGLPITTRGIRIPGTGSTFEAGVRAILGQQVSVKAAIHNVNLVVEHLGQRIESLTDDFSETTVLFPTPKELTQANLEFLKMPESRKQTLTRFAQAFSAQPDLAIDDWLELKGIGPWTVGYGKLRGNNEPDCFLASDLVIKKALANLSDKIDTHLFSPWGSYATFHLWHSQMEPNQ
jgi:AraC family transcriptional regulator of adaptative response / DNA-3-methyladenine glycosylase II